MTRIQREIDEEDAGIVKPSRGERLLAGRTKAYDRGDYMAVQCSEKLIEKRQGRRCAARARKRQRNTELRSYIVELDKERIADPTSDNDRS